MILELAPLHGVTNKTFRAAYFRHFGGFGAAMAPFILAVRTKDAKPNHFKDLLPGPKAERAASIPLVPQLLASDPEAFRETILVLADLGYAEVNLNLGCPYSMVAKKGRGSGLLPFPDRVEALLDSGCSISGIGVSVKLRLGRSDPSDIDRLMPALNERPLIRVILHPRVGTQMYRGSVDLGGFERAAASCRHPLVYNGDIVDRRGFDELQKRFPKVDSWMLGRGALANPFLSEELKGSAPKGDEAERLRAFHDDLYGSYREILCGPAHVLDKMKEVWSYLGASFPRAGLDLERITRVKSLEEYSSTVDRIFGR
jgi:tRNA-dihydrouridine synthase